MNIRAITVLSLIALSFLLWFNRPWNYFNQFSLPKSPVKTSPSAQPVQLTEATIKTVDAQNLKPSNVKMLASVGDPTKDHFGLSDEDFIVMQAAGINLIEGDFDICANDEDVVYFLSQAKRYNMRVVLNAGSGEAEWGYSCGVTKFPSNQDPVWQGQKVTEWVNKWKSYSTVFAWDTSQEAGSSFPNNQPLTASQLQTAYRTVKASDPNRAVLIKMNGQFFVDYQENFFRQGNPFALNVADIVVVNAFSNKGKYSNVLVKTILNRAISSSYQIDPHISYIASFGTWKDLPDWRLSTPSQLETDLSELDRVGFPVGIAFFKFGSSKSDWYLPKDAPLLWPIISSSNPR